MKKGRAKELVVTVDSLAIGGKGIGRVNGLVVFVPHVAPGDKVKVVLVKKKKAYALAKAVELIEASPLRTEAPCPHFGECGGCSWQHLQYHAQLLYKTQHVKEALNRISQIHEVDPTPTIPSPKRFRYRNKMEFTFGTGEKEGAREGPILGLHKGGSFWNVVPIEDCLLMPESGKEIMERCVEYIRRHNLSVYDIKSHKGLMRFLMLRHSVSFDNWLVNIITSQEDPAIFGLHNYLSHEYVKSIVNNINPRLAATAIGEKEIILSGDGFLEELFSDKVLRITANSFFQANSHSLLKLISLIESALEIDGNEHLIDAYSGVGTIGLFLANKVRSVTGIELTSANINLSELNIKLNRIGNMKVVLGKTEKVLKGILEPKSSLILDPPRAGLHKDVIKAIGEVRPRKVVYVSCNPTTLARDLSFLKDLYDISMVQPIDMFPQTPHIETVVGLKLKA